MRAAGATSDRISIRKRRRPDARTVKAEAGRMTKICEPIHIGVAKAGLLSSNRTPPVRTCPHSKAVQRPARRLCFFVGSRPPSQEGQSTIFRGSQYFQPFGLQPVRLSDCI